jgi:predicted  nucleic acid-binding Zn-ribbon protein
VHPAIPLLLQLQKTDLEISAFRSELEAAPKRMRELDGNLAGARNELAAAKEALTRALAARKKAELDVAAWRDKANKFRAQSSAVKTNEAYKALQHEIANAEAEAAKAEDLQLEQMMAVEGIEETVKSAEARMKQAEQTVASERKEIENRARETNRKMLEEVAMREKLAGQIPEDIVDRFTRLAKRHHGVAMAEAIEEQCRGCGMRIMPHMFQELLRSADHDLHFCENCGRILYAPRTLSYALDSGDFNTNSNTMSAS